MKATKEQWKKIKEINEAIKDLDPILKERIIDYELADLFKKDYLKILHNIKLEHAKIDRSDKVIEAVKPSSVKKIEEPPSIRDFYLEKQPNSLAEKVAVFGYYLEQFEKKDEFGEDDISNAFFEARARKPKLIGQSLRDAKNKKGYLVEGREKSKYRLSNRGENLILLDLPRKLNK